MSQLPFDNLESSYEALAAAIDTAGEKREALFLTRLALLLAHELGDATAFRRTVQAALDGAGIAIVCGKPCLRAPIDQFLSCERRNFSWNDALRFFAPHNIMSIISFRNWQRAGSILAPTVPRDVLK